MSFHFSSLLFVGRYTVLFLITVKTKTDTVHIAGFCNGVTAFTVCLFLSAFFRKNGSYRLNAVKGILQTERQLDSLGNHARAHDSQNQAH